MRFIASAFVCLFEIVGTVINALLFGIFATGLATFLALTFLFPPPATAPTGSNVAYKADANVASKAVAAVYFATTSWEVVNFGAVKVAKSKSNPEMQLIGCNGVWYGL